MENRKGHRRAKSKAIERQPDVYLMSDVLLLSRGVTLRVNKRGVGHQVTPVLHDETPVAHRTTHTLISTPHITQYSSPQHSKK